MVLSHEHKESASRQPNNDSLHRQSIANHKSFQECKQKLAHMSSQNQTQNQSTTTVATMPFIYSHVSSIDHG